jgi:fermentation-respiration switch protein FrsA (DUF1100 family)
VQEAPIGSGVDELPANGLVLAEVVPRELVWIETTNHIELYDQAPYLPQALERIVPWLEEHLGGTTR